jgi:drug/metabolite transporter (DMT)-like permease
LGAVFSRVAYQHAQVPLDGFTAAYQRLWGGLAFTLVSWVIFRFSQEEVVDWKKGTPWMLANALAGSILGVSCYQWALQTQPSGVVLPLVATTPLMIIPLAYGIEGTRPTVRTMIGATISVIGVILMNLLK